ncbi:MAG: hypothetical protein RBS49_06180 [Sphaerochaeta sp.]|jgi:hypothetical protein|nr:hypothetical protein [Sphaerochaeta sp.]MDX9915463.1 hypothetical protein [Sphaerochaeta sp.]
MKGVLCLCLLCSLSPLAAGATLMLEGEASQARYAMVFKSEVTSITLASDGTLTHGTVQLPLTDKWTLAAQDGNLKNHYASLESRRVGQLTLSDSHYAINTLFSRSGIAGLSLACPPISVGIFSFAPLDDSSLFVNYRDAWEGVALLVRLAHTVGPFALDWEVSWKRARQLATTNVLTVGIGPWVLTQRLGPRAGERGMVLAVKVEEGSVSCSLSLSTSLGAMAIYSGEQQQKTSSLTSALGVAWGSLVFGLDNEWVVGHDSAGAGVYTHVVGLSLSGKGWRLSMRWRAGGAPTYSFTDGANRLVGGKGHVGATFVHGWGPWRFTLQFGQNGVFSLRWRYTITMRRGSGSPPPT